MVEVRQEEANDKLVLAAYTGWQMGAGAGKTFPEYLHHLGLADAPPQGDSQKEQTPAQRIELQESQDAKLAQMGIEVKKVEA